jgi:ferredoxin
MAIFTDRYPLNVPGKFYIDAQCTDCDMCRECAPNNITRDDRMGHSYVFKQPENDAEVAAIMEGVEGCPTDAVGNDGDNFDWSSEPITDWNAISARWNSEVIFDISNPLAPDETTQKEAMSELQQKPWWKRIL